VVEQLASGWLAPLKTRGLPQRDALVEKKETYGMAVALPGTPAVWCVRMKPMASSFSRSLPLM
jgi:hypothetical protein